MTFDFAAATERIRQDFFSRYAPVNITELRPGMKIVIPEDPFEPGGGDLFMEVTSLGSFGNLQVSIIGRVTQAHCEAGEVGSEVVAKSPYDQVGLQSDAA